MHRCWAPVLLGLLACAGPSATGDGVQANSTDRLSQLAGRALLESQGPEMLRVLTEEIGPRVPGSEACARAERTVAERMRAIGMSNVHLEEVPLPDRWEPGDVWLELLSPEERRLNPVQLMWTGRAESSVVPVRRIRADAPIDGTATGQLLVTRMGAPMTHIGLRLQELSRLFARAQAAGARGLLLLTKAKHPPSVTAVDPARPAGLQPLPVMMLGAEDSDALEGLLARGPVRARFMARPRLAGPGVAHNVVGEVPGREPDQVVILGGHLDSVAGSPGAFDDGAGVVTALEVARVIRASGRTRRTLRVVAFTGEELGLVGSRAYVRQHQAELGKVTAMVQIDGVEQVWTDWMTFGRPDVEASLRRALAPLGAAGGVPRSRPMGPLWLSFSDHAPFALEGIPTTFAVKRDEVLGPEVKIHTPEDAFAAIAPGLLAASAATHAVLIHQLLESDEGLGRRMSADEVRAWVARERFEADAWMVGRGELLGAR